MKSAYGNKTRTPIHFDPEQGMTEQSHKNECDINQILSKYQRTGIITHAHQNQAQYGEISSLDFHESMNLIAEAKSTFETLPSSLRKRFENSPEKYLAFLEDENNLKEMQEMGLIDTPQTPPDNQQEFKQPTNKEESTPKQAPKEKSS